MLPKGGRETVLVAEDNEAVRELMRDVLIEYGYTVIEAINGTDAIEKFRKTDKVDLIILDSIMPGKNGREVYNEISQIRPGIKVLFTSGYTRDTILDKGIEDKKFAFLSKPMSPDGLLEKVREVLDK
jgi:CheY-like chemotaxis protein